MCGGIIVGSMCCRSGGGKSKGMGGLVDRKYKERR
jgi:hypothetical protein